TSNAETSFNSNQPGSVNDPIVTKSYVDELVKAEVAKQIGNANIGSAGGSTGTGGTGNVGSGQGQASLTNVRIAGGETLMAGAGTEFVIRTNGRTTIVSTDGNGVPDLTDGKDLPHG